MSIIKSISVGNGDMFYIKHGSSNFTIIDCNMDDTNRQKITDEIISESSDKDITRFISTHPDEDHIHGLKYLDDKIGILNFYCVKNEATKSDETDDFKKSQIAITSWTPRGKNLGHGWSRRIYP